MLFLLSKLQSKNKMNKTLRENIIENYRNMEISIVKQLALYHKHGTTTGSHREDVWLQLFETIVPKKFVLEHSVFIIDSEGNESNEVDLAIVDNAYTPYIFQYGRVKFIPIEAVAAVVECKSQDAGNVEEWSEKITRLKTSQNSIVRMATNMSINGNVEHGVMESEDGQKREMRNGSASSNNMPKATQTATRPIKIFCGYETGASMDNLLRYFDFVLKAKGNAIRIAVEVNPDKNLQEWYESLNHYGCDKNKIAKFESLDGLSMYDYIVEDKKKEEVSLLTFNFQLNQLLMLINNPILFPHKAYVAMLNGITQTDTKESGEKE